MKKTTIFLLSMFFAVNFFAVGVFASDKFGAVDIHGFISQGYLDSDDHKYLLADTDDGTFEFNEMGINFSTDINENLRLGMQLLSRDLGSIGNDEVDIDWAYADYRYRNWLGIRVGKIKKPAGMYNQARDIDSARTFILLPQSIYEERSRSASLTSKGVGFYGTLPGHLDYQVVYGALTVPSDGGEVQYVEQLYPMTIDDVDVDPVFNGELFWDTPLEGLRVGYTYNKGEFDLNIDEFELSATTIAAAEAAGLIPPGAVPPGWYPASTLAALAPGMFSPVVQVEVEYNIFSIEYTYENFMISAEYNDSNTEVDTTEADGEAYYVMTTYRFTDWFELGLYYSVWYPDKDDKDGKDIEAAGGIKETAYLKDYALCTRFDVNEYWTVKLELHIMDGLHSVNFDESDDPADPDPDWVLFAAKLSYSF